MRVYTYIHADTSTTERLQCSKVFRELSASATTYRRLGALGIYYSIIATLQRCSAMSF